MTGNAPEPPAVDPLTSFVTAKYYVVGDGESMIELQDSGRWVATADPVEVRA